MELWQLIKEYEKDQSKGLALLSSSGCSWMKNLQQLTREDLIWLLPEGVPEVPLLEGDQDAPTSIRLEFKRLGMFYTHPEHKDPYPSMKPVKRETLFLDIYQHLPRTEAKFLKAIKNKEYSEYQWILKL